MPPTPGQQHRPCGDHRSLMLVPLSPSSAPHEVKKEAVDRRVVRRHAGAHATAARLRAGRRGGGQAGGAVGSRHPGPASLRGPQACWSTSQPQSKAASACTEDSACTISSVATSTGRPTATDHPPPPALPCTCTISSVSMACRLLNSFSRSAANAWFQSRGSQEGVGAQRRCECKLGVKPAPSAAGSPAGTAVHKRPSRAPAAPARLSAWRGILPTQHTQAMMPTHLDVHLPAGGANRDQGARLHEGAREGSNAWVTCAAPRCPTSFAPSTARHFQLLLYQVVCASLPHGHPAPAHQSTPKQTAVPAPTMVS